MDGWEIDLHVTETSEDPLDIRITGTVKPISQPIEPPVEPPIVVVPPAIHPPGDDIRELLEMPGGRPVKVASGDYKGGPGVFPHDQRLVLYAEHPGEVGLDLGPDDLTLDYGSSNIVLAGFKARNGTIVNNGDGISLWYHDGSFPIEVWDAMYHAAGGGTGDPVRDKAAIQRMKHPVCKAVWIGLDTKGHQLKRNYVFGSDIHDCGDDGVFFDKTSGGIMGHRIWNVEEKQYDPNVNPWNSGDLFHNDAVQTPGAVDLQIASGYQQCVSNLGGDNASCILALDDLWIAGSGAVGLLVISQKNLYTQLSLRSVVGWSNGMGFRNDSGWNTMMTQFCDDRQIISWGTQDVTSSQGGAVGMGRFNIPNRFVTKDLGGNSDRVSPGGFAMQGPYLEDKLAPLNDPRNPALRWRERNPYMSWDNVLP